MPTEEGSFVEQVSEVTTFFYFLVHDYQLKIVRWCTKPAILFWPWTFVEKETPLQQQMKEILTLQLTISFILPKATMPVGHPIPEQYFLLLTFYLEWYVHTWTWKNAVGPILYKFGPFLPRIQYERNYRLVMTIFRKKQIWLLIFCKLFWWMAKRTVEV